MYIVISFIVYSTKNCAEKLLGKSFLFILWGILFEMANIRLYSNPQMSPITTPGDRLYAVNVPAPQTCALHRMCNRKITQRPSTEKT